MKTTAVVESLSYYKTNVLFQRIAAYLMLKLWFLIPVQLTYVTSFDECFKIMH